MPEQTRPRIDQMSFDQIAEYMGQIDGRTAAANGGALTQRLYEIALFDNHIPQSHREGARNLLQIIRPTMEQYLAAISPEALDKYRAANAGMEENAQKLGVGSLAWLILEKRIPNEQISEFATRPEYAHLLNDFLSVLSSEVAAQISSLAEERKTQRLAESKASADPEFLGNFITAQLFLKINFNITEERFKEICAGVPESVRDIMPVWSFFYLSWLMRLAVRRKYGEEFEAEMMRAAYGRLMNAPREVSTVAMQAAQYIRYWFDEFDRRFEDFRDKGPTQVAGHEIPFEWGIAMSLLMLDSGSPYFLDRTKIQKTDDPPAAGGPF